MLSDVATAADVPIPEEQIRRLSKTLNEVVPSSRTDVSGEQDALDAQ